MPKKAFNQQMGEWKLLAEAVARNLHDFEHLRDYLEILTRTLEQLLKAKQRQAALRAEAQQATRDLEAAMAVATQAAVQLNHGILATYTNRSEKLREFHLRPRKGPGPHREKPAAAAEQPAPAPRPRRRRK